MNARQPAFSQFRGIVKTVYCFMLIFGLAILSSAQSSKSHLLSGVVVDQTGAVIADAIVHVLDRSGKVLQSSTTDESGTFQFKVEQAGQYPLTIRHDGFRDLAVAVQVKSNALTMTKVVMQIATQSESIIVGAGDAPQVSTEIADNQSANTVDRAELDHLPVFDMDYIGTLSRFLSDDATGTNGVTLVVNGLEANGPGVSPSAIKNVRIRACSHCPQSFYDERELNECKEDDI